RHRDPDRQRATQPAEHPEDDADVEATDDRGDELSVGRESPDGHEGQQEDRRQGRERQDRTSCRHACRIDHRQDVLEVPVAGQAPVLSSDPPQRSCRRPTHVTGPATGDPDRGPSAPMRTTGTRSAAGAILIVLALGLALRLIIAYVLPGSGFANDLASFRGWAHDLFTNGLYGFYARPGFHDYTPGYLYYLWVLGAVSQLLPSLDLVKIPAILSDLAIGWLIWSMVPEL